MNRQRSYEIDQEVIFCDNTFLSKMSYLCILLTCYVWDTLALCISYSNKRFLGFPEIFVVIVYRSHYRSIPWMAPQRYFWHAYKTEKNYTKPLFLVIFYYGAPFPKWKSSRARAASFFSPRLGQRRWRLVTGNDVFWVHKVKIKDENMKLCWRADYWVFKPVFTPYWLCDPEQVS